ncbi:MAG TPA: AMP-binding protein, partial [Candidatus Dormibacteraeota bacterium]|nr:AMP-binding protein [Candidatus Dormibacteraeota bacterium]
MSKAEPVWVPSAEQVADSRLGRFASAWGCSTYAELCRKASEDPRWFWNAMVRDLGISWSTPYREVMDTSLGAPFTRWFTDGRLNAYDSSVAKHAESSPTALALLAEDEAGTTRRLTYAELKVTVERAAAGLRSLGVTRGTAVGLYLPLVIENAVALLACAKLGAIAVPLFSGFGADAIRQRLEDAGATLLVTADGALRRGRPVPMKTTADQALEGLPDITSVVVVSCARLEVPMRKGRDLAWDQLLSGAEAAVGTEPMSPQDPLLLLYTSG